MFTISELKNLIIECSGAEYSLPKAETPLPSSHRTLLLSPNRRITSHFNRISISCAQMESPIMLDPLGKMYQQTSAITPPSFIARRNYNTGKSLPHRTQIYPENHKKSMSAPIRVLLIMLHACLRNNPQTMRYCTRYIMINAVLYSFDRSLTYSP